MKIKNPLLLFISISMLLPLTSCGSSTKWDVSNEKLNKAIDTNATLITDKMGLVLGIDSDNFVFNEGKIDKSKLIVKVDYQETKEFVKDQPYYANEDEFKRGSTDDYTLNLSDDNETLVLIFKKEVVKDSVEIIIHDTCTTAGEYVYSYFSKSNIPVVINEPEVEAIITNDYFSGAVDPKFYFKLKNTNLISADAITFVGAFEDLTVDECLGSDGNLTLLTKGKIKNDHSGSICFNSGSFLDLNDNAIFTYEVKSDSAFFDPKSLMYDEDTKEGSIDIYFTNNCYEFDPNDFEISGDEVIITWLDVDFLMNKVTIYFEVVDEDIKTIDDLVDWFTVASITVDESSYLEILGYKINIIFGSEEPEFSTITTIEDGQIKIDFYITDGYFDSNISNFDYYLELPSICSGVTLGEEPTARFVDENHIEITDSISGSEEALKYVKGDLVILKMNYYNNYLSELKINATEEGETGDYTGEMYVKFYHSDYDKHDDSRSKNILNASNDIVITDDIDKITEKVHDELQSAKLHWTDYAQMGLGVLGLGLSIGGSIYTGGAEGAAGLIGLGFDLIGGIINCFAPDPFEQLINAIASIQYSLAEINTKLNDLSQELEKSSAKILYGIDKNLFLQYRSNWKAFLKEMDPFLNIQSNTQSKLLSDVCKWVRKETDSIELHYIQDKKSTTEGKDFCITLVDYEGQSIDDDNSDVTNVKFTINKNSDLFKTAKPYASRRKGGHKEITKYIQQDIKNYFEDNQCWTVGADGKLGGAITVDNSSIASFNNYLKVFTHGDPSKMTEADRIAFATTLTRDMLNTKFNDTLKDLYPKSEEDKARDLENTAINIFNKFGADGDGAFTDFYNMLYSKYAFQNEALTAIRSFRVSMERTMYNAAMLSRTVLALNIDTYDDINNKLKPAYENVTKIFHDNTGIRDTAKHLQDNPDLYSCDYCYVTNTFVTMSLIKNVSKITGHEATDGSKGTNIKAKDSMGISSYNMILSKKNGDTFRGLERASIIDNLTYRNIMDRRKLSGTYKDLNNLDFLGKVGVLAPKVKEVHDKAVNDKVALPNEVVTKIGNLEQVDYNNYPAKYSVRGTAALKVTYSAYYFKKWNTYLLSDTPSKSESKYYTAWRKDAICIDGNDFNPLKNYVNHVWMYREAHAGWYHEDDEFWGFNQYMDGYCFYSLINC